MRAVADQATTLQTPHLTSQQRAVLDAIVAFVDEHGHGPTCHELERILGCAETTLARHMRWLEHYGYARRSRRRPITLLRRPDGER